MTLDQNGNPQAQGAGMDTKNLGIIQDQMHHEALAYKKCRVCSEWLSDQTLKDIANRAAQHHKQHFDSLDNYLRSHSCKGGTTHEQHV